jgi:O-antigen ligase
VLANLALVAYLVLLRNIVAGLLIYLYALIFLNYYWRIVIPGVWPDLDIPRLVFIFVWIVFLLELALSRKRLLPNTSIGSMMLLVLTAFIVNMVIGRITMIRQFLNGYVIPYAMFVMCKNVFVERRQVERFVAWLALPLAFYFPAMATIEHYNIKALLFPRYIGNPSIANLEGVDWGGRAMGTFFQPVVTGFAMIAVFLLALHVLSRSSKPLSKLYLVILVLITPIGVFFTYTRSVYVGFASGLIMLLAFSRRLRVVVLIMLVGMGLGVMANWSNVTRTNREEGGLGEVNTAQARVVIAKASLAMFVDHPFTGVGFTKFIANAQPYIARVRSTFLGYKETWVGARTNQHNQFLSVLTEIGLIGFVPLVMLYVLIVRLLIGARGVASGLYDPEFPVVVASVMAAYISQILFIEPRFFEFMNVLPFMLLGIIAGEYQRSKTLMAKTANPVGGWPGRSN